MNNITVDGSYFNNSFGLGGQPGDRTGVAPISLDAIEQVQVSVAPYDCAPGQLRRRRLNTVTRSGTNTFTASVYRRMRNESYVGTNAAGLTFNPGTFTTYTTGVWAGGPIVKNRLFAFGSFEKQEDTRPLTTFVSNPGGLPASGQPDARSRVGPQCDQRVLVVELRLRHRPIRAYQQGDAGKAAAHQDRLQRQQLEQGQVPLQPAGFEHRREHVVVVFVGQRQADWQHELPDVQELELFDSREHQVGNRRVELGDPQHKEGRGAPRRPLATAYVRMPQPPDCDRIRGPEKSRGRSPRRRSGPCRLASGVGLLNCSRSRRRLSACLR